MVDGGEGGSVPSGERLASPVAVVKCDLMSQLDRGGVLVSGEEDVACAGSRRGLLRLNGCSSVLLVVFSWKVIPFGAVGGYMVTGDVFFLVF